MCVRECVLCVCVCVCVLCAAVPGGLWCGQPKLRKLLQKGDFFLGAVLASTLTKLALRTQELHGE